MFTTTRESEFAFNVEADTRWNLYRSIIADDPRVEVNQRGEITSVATCACGALYFASERQADDVRVVTATGTGPLICDNCRTSATDHAFMYGDDEGRCFDCDMRSYRHR